MYKYIVITLLAFLPFTIYAQQGEKVKCQVVDGKTFKPIKFAVVEVEGIKDTANRRGVVIIYIHDAVQVKLQADGYEDKTLMVQPGAAKTTQYLKMYPPERKKREILN